MSAIGGKTGKHLLGLRLTGFDPSATLVARRFCNATKTRADIVPIFFDSRKGRAPRNLEKLISLLIETGSDKDALWALEEALRSQARPAMVAETLGIIYA